MDDDHHDDRRDDQRGAGDRDADDALGRPRPLAPGDRTAHDAPAGADRPRRARVVGTARGRASQSTSTSPSTGRRLGRSSTGRVDERDGVARRAARSQVVRVRSVTHGAGNDASRRRPIGRHRTARSSPVTLNPMWVAIDMPEPAGDASAQAPSDQAEHEQARVLDRAEVDERRTIADGDEPGERRALKRAATSPAAGRGRRAPRRSARRRTTISTSSTIVAAGGPVDQVLGVLLQPVVGERVGPDRSRSGR